MSNYWPKRNDPKGFSIESLSKKYKARLRELSNITNIPIPNVGSTQEQNNFDKFSNSLCNTKPSSKEINHWANRDYK